jgi:hypothetical protein
MNLPTIQMDKWEARKAFLEYRGAVRDSLDKEADTLDARKREVLARRRETDEAMMNGYRVLSLGRIVVDLERCIREGGEDESFRPRLAVSRADQERISMRRWRDGSVTFNGQTTRDLGPTPAPGSRSQREFSFGRGTLPTQITDSIFSNAIVPTIPPHLRPDSLNAYHILWEAEWTAVAPKDPALLRALGSGLYAVVAVWDLTEIERAVLGIERR